MAYSLDPVLGSVGWGVALNNALDDLDSRIDTSTNDFASYQATVTPTAVSAAVTGWALYSGYSASTHITYTSGASFTIVDEGIYTVSLLGTPATAVPAGGEFQLWTTTGFAGDQPIVTPQALIGLMPAHLGTYAYPTCSQSLYLPAGTTVEVGTVGSATSPSTVINLEFVKVK
jgi:hypothetical protein